MASDSLGSDTGSLDRRLHASDVEQLNFATGNPALVELDQGLLQIVVEQFDLVLCAAEVGLPQGDHGATRGLSRGAQLLQRRPAGLDAILPRNTATVVQGARSLLLD